MGHTEILKDRIGAVLARIEHSGGIQRIYDRSGQLLGRYEVTTNRTYDRAGRIVGTGNLLTTLLR